MGRFRLTGHTGFVLRNDNKIEGKATDARPRRSNHPSTGFCATTARIDARLAASRRSIQGSLGLRSQSTDRQQLRRPHPRLPLGHLGPARRQITDRPATRSGRRRFRVWNRTFAGRYRRRFNHSLDWYRSFRGDAAPCAPSYRRASLPAGPSDNSRQPAGTSSDQFLDG